MLTRHVARLALVAALLSACTVGDETTRTAQPAGVTEVASQFAQVPEGKALVHLYRPFDVRGSANVYRFKFNGVIAADLGPGERVAVPMPPGPVTIESHVRPSPLNIGLGFLMLKETTINFEAEEGMVYFVQVTTVSAGGPEMGHVAPATASSAASALKLADPP